MVNSTATINGYSHDDYIRAKKHFDGYMEKLRDDEVKIKNYVISTSHTRALGEFFSHGMVEWMACIEHNSKEERGGKLFAELRDEANMRELFIAFCRKHANRDSECYHNLSMAQLAVLGQYLFLGLAEWALGEEIIKNEFQLIFDLLFSNTGLEIKDAKFV